MAGVHPQPLDEIVDRLLGALDDLQESGTVEEEQPGNAVERVQMPRRLVDRRQILVAEVEAGPARVGQGLQMQGKPPCPAIPTNGRGAQRPLRPA